MSSIERRRHSGSLHCPARLVAAAEREGRTGWLATLADTLDAAMARWQLSVGPPFEPGGQAAWVAPARDAAGTDLVLKLGWRHPEAEDEAEGLRHWDGQGTVRLYAASRFGDTDALVQERCRPGSPLALRPELEQDEVIAGLLSRLWAKPAPADLFRPLQVMCDEWAEGFERRDDSARSGLDPGLARAGVELFRTLPGTAEREVLLATDLHAGNVLAAEREPWLAIDPKPYVGDPTYDALQHLLNCTERLRRDPLGLVRRMAGLLGLDADRLSRWLFARCVIESPDWSGLAGVAVQLAPR
ncbi:MAG: kinase [Actinobacteria bacterium]|nr:kinase [Actinomycetota bacterium]